MLTVGDDLSMFALGAGEPFLFQTALQKADGSPLDLTGRAFVLTFYKAGRTVVTKIDGELSDDGTFLRFEEPGTFSEALYGQGLSVELAERLKDGRRVLATGTLTVKATAATVASLDNGRVGDFAVRVTIKATDALGDKLAFSQEVVAYVPPGTTPTPQLTLTGPLTYATNAASGTLIANIGNVPAGVTPTITPGDGREVIAGDATNGWKIVVGMTASSAGTISTTVAATGATSVTEDVTVTAPTPTVTLSAAQSKAEGNSGTTVFTYTVTRSSSSGAVNVPWSFAAGSTSASDFTGGTLPAGGTVAMADGVASGTITISVNGDTTVEPDEQFTVSIAAPSGYAAGSAMSATGTILNDDTANMPKLAAGISRVKAGTGRAVLACVGDSVTDGWGGGDTVGGGAGDGGAKWLRTGSWPGQLAGLLSAAGIPSRADALVTGCQSGGTMASMLSAYPNLSASASWTVSNIQTLGGMFLTADSNSTGSLTFTPLVAADTFDLFITGASSLGQFSVTDQDGSLGVADESVVSGTNPPPSGGLAFRSVRFTRSASSLKPVSIQRTGGGQLYLAAIIPFDTKAPRFEIINMGWPGSKSSDWIATDAPWSTANALKVFTGYADAFTLELGANDSNAGVSASDYQSGIQSIANNLAAMGDVLLAKCHKTPNNAGFNMSAAYLSAIDTVQASVGKQPAADFNSLSLTTADFCDTVHLAQSGYAKEAAAMKAALLAGAGIS